MKKRGCCSTAPLDRQHHYRVASDKILQFCKVQVKSVIIIQCQFLQLATGILNPERLSLEKLSVHLLSLSECGLLPFPLRVDNSRACIGSSAPTSPGRRYTYRVCNKLIGYRPEYRGLCFQRKGRYKDPIYLPMLNLTFESNPMSFGVGQNVKCALALAQHSLL